MPHPLRWCWYLVRLALSITYAVLNFASKPGSRFIVVTVLAAGAYLFFPQVKGWIADTGLFIGPPDDPEALLFNLMVALTVLWLVCVFGSIGKPNIVLIGVVIGWWLTLDATWRAHLLLWLANARGSLPEDTVLYGVMVAVLLTAILLLFPLLSKALAAILGVFPPLPWPLRPRRVLAARNRVIVPAPAMQAVPPLCRAAPGEPYDVQAALPPEVAALLTPLPSPSP